MNNEIVVSKIVGSATESSWSQASSTGKLYVVLSLSSQQNEQLIAKGKGILEQIQREFFAIDNKNLYEIKNAIEKVFGEIDKSISYSAVVAAIKDDILYVITVSSAVVIIERQNNLAEVARGEEGKIIGFSGRLKYDDLIILETETFNKKISNKLLAEYTGSHDPEKLAEDLAPFIHENSTGEEAAIIINYKNPIEQVQRSEFNSYEPIASEEREPEKPDTEDEAQDLEAKRPRNFTLPFINKFKNISKRQKLIIVFIVLTAILLAGSLVGERIIEQRRIASEEFKAVFEVSSERLATAKNLSSLNRGRALEEVNTAIADIEASLDKFNEGSDEYNKLNDLLNELKTLQNELGGGSQIAGDVIFSSQDSEILESIDDVSFSNNRLIVLDSNGYTVLDEDGEIQNEEEIDLSNIKRAISDNTYLYILGNNVTRINISNGTSANIIPNTRSFLDISFFGSNLYLLENGGDYISRFSGSNYQKGSYLNEETSISGTPLSFAIDGSIYVLNENGVIQKFSRGVVDNDFELDSRVQISKNALLYANEELSNIYLLDRDNASVVVINPEGEIIKQFNSLELQNAKSFTINSDESNIYVVIDEQVYSYNL